MYDLHLDKAASIALEAERIFGNIKCAAGFVLGCILTLLFTFGWEGVQQCLT